MTFIQIGEKQWVAIEHIRSIHVSDADGAPLYVDLGLEGGADQVEPEFRARVMALVRKK